MHYNIGDAVISSKLYITIGPMYSGKTTQLILNYNLINKSLYNQQIVIDYDFNTSNDNSNIETVKLYSHDKKFVDCIKLHNFNDIYKLNLTNIKIIHINEAQFYSNLKDIVLDLLENKNITIYIYALDGDFKRKKFGEILDLIPYCDSVYKLSGKCYYCNSVSIFSHRIVNSSEQILENNDNNPSYIPVCRYCYIVSNFN
jgi:thymidine kinase